MARQHAQSQSQSGRRTVRRQRRASGLGGGNQLPATDQRHRQLPVQAAVDHGRSPVPGLGPGRGHRAAGFREQARRLRRFDLSVFPDKHHQGPGRRRGRDLQRRRWRFQHEGRGGHLRFRLYPVGCQCGQGGRCRLLRLSASDQHEPGAAVQAGDGDRAFGEPVCRQSGDPNQLGRWCGLRRRSGCGGVGRHQRRASRHLRGDRRSPGSRKQWWCRQHSGQ